MLKVWLPLDGDLRNLGVSDVKITNNGASINNSGKIGSCYHFGPSSPSFMTLPKEIMTSFTTECSIAFWLKIKTWNVSYATYFQAGLGSTPWVHYIFGFLRNSTNSTACFTISNGSSASNANYLTSTLELNKWYHVALTYKTGKCTIYLDGKLDHEYSTSIIPAFSSITHITLGACNNGSNYQTDCDMNDVRIYDHCLSAAEVHEIAQGLILHYKLDASSEEKITTIPSTNVYSYPTFNTSAAGGGWYHWGPSGHSGSYGQNTDKKFIYNKNNTYSHWITEDAGTGKYYLLYQSPAFEGGYRSLQAIIKEENGLPITESICYPTWNARNGGVPNNKWTSIKDLGDGFYYCCCEGVSQDGSNDLIGIDVKPGYKIYISECYLENNAEKCSPIFSYSSNIIQDSSGYGHNGTIINTITISSDTPRYNNCTHMSATNQKILINNIITSGFSNSYTIAWWGKCATFSGTMHWGFSNGVRLNGIYNGTLWNTGDGSNNPLYKPGTTTQVTTPSTGVWHHFAMIGDGTNCKVYLDGNYWGIAKTYKSISGTSIYLNGWNSSTLYSNSDLSLSDFRIYCTALLDSDIKLLYKTGMRVDNLGGVHTFEFEENQSNIFRSELIMPVAKAGKTTRIGEIVEHNGYYAMNIAPEPFYKNISNSVSGFLQGQFFPNTSYIFDLWVDVDSVIYNGNNVAGGLNIIFTDGSSNNSFVFIGGNKGWQHKKIITPSNKTIDRLTVYYYISTDVFYRLDSYICPISSTKIMKQGILDTTNITENSEIASFYKGGSIYSSKFIEM